MTATIAIARPWRCAWRNHRSLVYWLLLLLAAGSGLSAQEPQRTGYFVIPGDAKAGIKTFFDKGCVRCHAVLGEGGKSAPDLGRAPAGHLSAAELVAAMWNHAPQMWIRMQQEKVTPPSFTEPEMSNLFAFLYSVRAMDEPGDAERGRQLLSEKRCVECHGTAGRKEPRAPDLREWGSYRNPVSWIQAMWNHAPAMQALMEARGLPWPKFEGNDVADLIAYIRTQATSPHRHFYLRPADPELGRRLFREKGCANCHSLRGAGPTGAPDLGARTLPRTVGQFSAQMWNHSPAMWARMKAQQIPRPQFSSKEMADLIAYLFQERYFDPSGDALRGKEAFEVKGCAACHLPDGKGVGPGLSRWQGRVSPVGLAAAMWNHGPVMLGRMHEQQMPWPLFRPREMVDLMEYLNRGQQESRVAEPRR